MRLQNHFQFSSDTADENINAIATMDAFKILTYMILSTSDFIQLIDILKKITFFMCGCNILIRETLYQ